MNMEKYEIFAINYSAEKNLNEKEYSCNITIGLHPTDGVAPNFSKDISVVSDNSQTGYEVDKQRQEAIDKFLIEINK